MSEPRAGSTGIVIGKFDPPHRGHSLIVDVACAHVDRVIIALWDYAGLSVAADVRARWLREIFPDVEVRIIPDAPDATEPTSWAAQVLKYLNAAPEVLFTSEPYGEELARHFGARHHNIDRDRRLVSVTGTMIRRAPLDHLAWLEPCVRAHYVVRVAVVGAESTGKTTLCKNLAAHFETDWVPEYGRDYSVAKQRQGMLGRWSSDEFYHIAREQQRTEDEAARSANRLVIGDTDAFATRIWHERYRGTEPVAWPLPPSRPSLYLIPYPDVPFVPDEIRDGEHMRYWMHERFIAEFERTGRKYVVLQGSWEARTAQAIAAVAELLLRSSSDS